MNYRPALYRGQLFHCSLPFLLMLATALPAAAQKTTVLEAPSGGRARVVAGSEYKAGGLKKLMMGSHYRAEWTEPTWVPVLSLDTLGGLTPVEQGGGRQTTTLRLKDAGGRQYVLRSIDKNYGGALPEIARGTFVERMAKDQVSTGHPYAALTVPMMAEAAGVYHTRPTIVLVPDDPRLGQYRETFANLLCLFEERPDDNESSAPNFGNAKDVVGTEKMYEKIRTESDARVDQEAFVRARLFDIFLGDWGRHDDQWRWGKFKENGHTIYRPIPRDRDQAYAVFDGLLPTLATTPEPLEVFQTFRGHIKNIKKYNFPARYIDRQLTNEVPEERWAAIAQDLQGRLTDAVIETSVHQLPDEVFKHSGASIIGKLKSRRGHLVDYAQKYARYLSKEVEIVGTKGAERFVVQPVDNKRVQVQLFAIDAGGSAATAPFFSRSFDPTVTKEIRLFGLSGADVFYLQGKRSIKVRVIGSSDKDEIGIAGGGKKVIVYDNPDDVIKKNGAARVHLSSDTSINRYEYKSFVPNTGHTIKSPSYNNLRGIHFNVGYVYRRYHFRKEPFSWEQRLRFNYSFSNKSVGGDYNGIFNQVIGQWNLLLDARFDQVLKHYYYGIGNETKAVVDLPAYYRMHTEEGAASAGLERPLGKHHRLGFAFGYDRVKVLQDSGHFSSFVLPFSNASVLQPKEFGSVSVHYNFHALDNEAIPRKGFSFSVSGRYGQNLADKNRSFQRYDAAATGYIPFTKVIALVLRAGGATVEGQPEFYQMPTLGGGATLRGFRRERFYGKSMAFNQNELRFLWDVRSLLFNGKAGLIGFFDDGRVWIPGENSGTWHSGYGAGLMFAPFNRVAITVAYGVSKEDQVINLRVGTKIF